MLSTDDWILDTLRIVDFSHTLKCGGIVSAEVTQVYIRYCVFLKHVFFRGVITGYCYIGIAIVFIFSPYIRKFSYYF